ncbi:MAG: hypothetical protein QM744_09545 [Mesorhizobium sp.]
MLKSWAPLRHVGHATSSKRCGELSALALVDFRGEQTFHDETAVDAAELERILATVSFVGPAMNPERTAAFRERLRAIPYPPVWARRFTLYRGRRRRSQPSCPA